MSINSMTNAAIARRPDFEPLGETPRTYSDNARAAALPPRPVIDADPAPEAARGTASGATSGAAGVNTALQTITNYIPIEILTLYVAAVSALAPTGTRAGAEFRRWLPFATFLLLTPLVTWVVFAAKVRNSGKPLPADPRTWPVWEMVAATVAYVAWAMALPDSPFQRFDWFNPALAGFAVLLVSTVLGMVAPLVQRPIPVAPTRPQDPPAPLGDSPSLDIAPPAGMVPGPASPDPITTASVPEAFVTRPDPATPTDVTGSIKTEKVPDTARTAGPSIQTPYTPPERAEV